MPSNRSKYWCFTLNNYTTAEFKDVQDSFEKSEDISYIIFGREVGESGTPHLQGYMEFKQRIRLGSVKRIPGFGRCHLEVRRGTAAEAADYCRKDGETEEYGEVSKSQQGKRSDLLTIKDAIDNGTSESVIAQEHFGQWVRYRKSFSAYRGLRAPKESREIQVYVLYGEPGTGKTRFVFEKHPDVWINSDPTLQWFDGYGGEEVVLLDDYRGDGRSAFLLRLLDRYPIKVPVKGGFVQWLPTIIYITSNMSPPFGHEDISGPLRRRIKKVMHLISPLDFNDREAIDQFGSILYQ